MSERKPWHESEEFWALRDRFMFGPERWEAVPGEVDHVLALLGVEAGAEILDLCCGPGRHSLELARRGFAVTGVDRTVAYLERARSLAQAEGLEIRFVQDDMRRFRQDEAFDAAINLFTSFGYFEDSGEDRKVLSNLWASLRPGGRLVMEMMGKEILARRFRRRDWAELDGILMLADRSVDRDWTWMRNREIYIEAGGRHEFLLEHRLYSGEELRTQLTSSRFSEVSLYGNLAGTPYDLDATRLVAVALK
jgi:SAM-dependent methyltransferase